MDSLVRFPLTFLKFPLTNAINRSTISILHRPPLIGIAMKETCASTMSPVRKTCSSHCLYLQIVHQCHGYLFYCSGQSPNSTRIISVGNIIVNLIIFHVDVCAVGVFLCHAVQYSRGIGSRQERYLLHVLRLACRCEIPIPHAELVSLLSIFLESPFLKLPVEMAMDISDSR